MIDPHNWLIGLYILLIFIIYLVWYLSFSVPADVCNPFTWLWENYNFLMATYVVMIILMTIVLFQILLSPDRIKFEAPLHQTSILMLATSVLLISNFFIEPPHPDLCRTYDSHPLLFFTALYFTLLSLISGIVETRKNF